MRVRFLRHAVAIRYGDSARRYEYASTVLIDRGVRRRECVGICRVIAPAAETAARVDIFVFASPPRVPRQKNAFRFAARFAVTILIPDEPRHRPRTFTSLYAHASHDTTEAASFNEGSPPAYRCSGFANDVVFPYVFVARTAT